ncbi:unnamed protein product, partial [Symbiodinium pilosum]
PSAKLIEQIEELCNRFPAGFTKPEGVQELDIDIAELQLRRYETLQRAKRKLRVCLRWMKLKQGEVKVHAEEVVKDEVVKEASQRNSDKPDSLKPIADIEEKAKP